MKWVYCPRCKHKLFLVDLESAMRVEIKCHSCKSIETVSVAEGKIKVVIKPNEKV